MEKTQKKAPYCTIFGFVSTAVGAVLPIAVLVLSMVVFFVKAFSIVFTWMFGLSYGVSDPLEKPPLWSYITGIALLAGGTALAIVGAKRKEKLKAMRISTYILSGIFVCAHILLCM